MGNYGPGHPFVLRLSGHYYQVSWSGINEIECKTDIFSWMMGEGMFLSAFHHGEL